MFRFSMLALFVVAFVGVAYIFMSPRSASCEGCCCTVNQQNVNGCNICTESGCVVVAPEMDDAKKKCDKHCKCEMCKDGCHCKKDHKKCCDGCKCVK